MKILFLPWILHFLECIKTPLVDDFLLSLQSIEAL